MVSSLKTKGLTRGAMLEFTEQQRAELETRIKQVGEALGVGPEEALYVIVQRGLDAIEKIGPEKGRENVD